LETEEIRVHAPRNAVVAGVLSVLMPGLGQLYNGQGRKAIFLFVGGGILLVLAQLARVPYYFWGFCLTMGGVLTFRIFLIVDAVTVARRSGEFVPRRYNKPIVYIGICVGIFVLVLLDGRFYDVRSFLGTRAFRVPSESNQPALEVGDLFMSELFGDDEPGLERGDFCVFLYPGDKKTFYIKRVVGFFGEAVELRDGRLYIDGRMRTEAWSDFGGRGAIVLKARQGPYEVPPGHFFMLGDNLGNSMDSRDFGAVKRELLVGKALYIYFSMHPHKRDVRWSRIGKDLRAKNVR